MNTLLVVVGLILAGIGAFWYYDQQKKKESGFNADDNSTTQESEVEKEKFSFEPIIKAEETFALGNLVSTELNDDLGMLNDKLIEVLPIMNEEFEHAEVTFKINEMASKIIPSKVSSFVSLDKETQSSRSADFKHDIAKLTSVVEKANEVVKQTNLSKDERETLLIGIKY